MVGARRDARRDRAVPEFLRFGWIEFFLAGDLSIVFNSACASMASISQGDLMILFFGHALSNLYNVYICYKQAGPLDGLLLFHLIVPSRFDAAKASERHGDDIFVADLARLDLLPSL